MSVRLAKQRAVPARVGYGTGVSYINVNRNIIDPKTRRWWEGPNYEGPSDKTVAVVEFAAVTGEPIAVYYNYAMHAVTVGQLDLVSADAPGTASHYIEDSFDDKIVALVLIAQGEGLLGSRMLPKSKVARPSDDFVGTPDRGDQHSTKFRRELVEFFI